MIGLIIIKLPSLALWLPLPFSVRMAATRLGDDCLLFELLLLLLLLEGDFIPGDEDWIILSCHVLVQDSEEEDNDEEGSD